MPLYQERYRLLVAADAPLGDRESVTWAEVAQVPLCLLTPDMQNRRIIERLLRETGVDPNITLESDSMILLYSHVRTGRWASVMPARLAASLGLTDVLRAVPIVGAGSDAYDRAGRAGARADDAIDRRAGDGSAAHRAAVVGLTILFAAM